MILLQLLIFLVITTMGGDYLFKEKTYIVRDGFDKTQQFSVSNHQYLLLFILATAVIACGEFMAYRLMICIIICLLGIFLSPNRIVFSSVLLLYSLYLFWLIIEIYLSPAKEYGFRVFLKYLYPFLIMLFACKVVQVGYSNKLYIKALKVILDISFYTLLMFLIVGRIPFIGSFLRSFLFYGPAIIDFYPVPITISLFLFSYTGRKKYLFYAVLLIFPSIIGSIRTGILAASITIVVFAIVRYKIKSIPYVVIGFSLLVGSVLFVPQIREKMFKEQMSIDEIMERREDLTTDDIDSSGRFAFWEWALKNFYEGKELTGSGLGILQHTLYNEEHPFVSGKGAAIHNDYVQILCDVGLVGLVLYLLSLFSLVIHSISVYLRSKTSIVKTAAFISGVSLAGMISTLYTDNVVNYSMMTLSFPFALYGMMLGLKSKYNAI